MTRQRQQNNDRAPAGPESDGRQWLWQAVEEIQADERAERIRLAQDVADSLNRWEEQSGHVFDEKVFVGGLVHRGAGGRWQVDETT